jgi:hypothetical protein
MSTSASLDPAEVTVEPGNSATAVLQVHNSGPTVESYRFEPVGEDAPWITVQPAGLSLFPGTSESVAVHFQPPRSSAALAGGRPFGVRVVPADHPEQMAVPEGLLTVLPFVDLTGELTPRASTGPVRGRHQVALDNPGNAPLAVRLTAMPADEQIRLAIHPDEIVVQPGQAGFARVDARARRRLWRGAPASHPFQVTATATTGQTLLMDGTYQQQPLVARWVPRVVTFAVVALVALLALWFALVRPVVRSAARQVADQQVAKRLDPQPGRPAQPGGNPGTNPGGGGGGGGGGQATSTPTAAPSSTPPPTTAPPAAAPAAPVPLSGRLEVRDSVGGTSSADAYRVPDKQILSVTDMVVQNPQGDAGTLVISTQGRTLLVLAMENFRDDPYYFSTPIVVPSGQTLVMTVTCRQVGAPVAAPAPPTCFESLLLSGSLRPVPRTQALTR